MRPYKVMFIGKPLPSTTYDAYTESQRILKEMREYEQLVKGLKNEKPKC